MQLNIGSGVHPIPGWINLDANSLADWRVDVVASAVDLPFSDGIADRVYFGHVLEHLSYGVDAPRALSEALRVLRPGGQVGIVGPAMDLAMRTKQPSEIIDAIKASAVVDGDSGGGLSHLWEAWVQNTYELVVSVFTNADVVPVEMVNLLTGWPNEEIATWQVALIGSKAGITP